MVEERQIESLRRPGARLLAQHPPAPHRPERDLARQRLLRYALSYLYQGRVTAHVLGADPVLSDLVRTPSGFWSLPSPILPEAWKSPPSFHRYDEVVISRLSEARDLRLLEDGDSAGLSPLPEGAPYAPQLRIARDRPPPAEWRLLAEGP